MLRTSLAIAMIATVGFATQSLAQTETDEAKDAAFNEAIMDFGELAGNAHSCLEGDAQAAHETLSVNIYNRINQLFGSNRAFRFSVRYGYGAAGEFDAKECEDIVRDFKNNYAAARERYKDIK